MLVAAVVAAAACESPARVKPWRHAPDPTTEADRAPGSPALADVSSGGEVRAARAHTLRIQLDAEPGRLHPILSPTIWGRRITLGTVFEPLIRYLPPDDGQAAGRFAPRLARSWRVSPSGHEIRIELEQGAKFHDGRPVTSVDVQFTLDTIRDPRRNIDHLHPLLADIEAVELITTWELRIRLERPSGWVLRALAELPVLPAHIYDGSLAAGGALVGSGPYKVASNKGGIVHLERNAKYWGPAPAIEHIELVYQPDAAEALVQAKRGDFDIIPAMIRAHYPGQASSPGIAAAFEPLHLRPPGMRYIAFNAQRSPLDDVRVRKALALLVNRRDIAERVAGRLQRPALWPIWPGGFISAHEAQVPAFDPAAAAKLLDEAGWRDSNNDGIRDRDGAQLRLVLVSTEPPAQKDPSNAPPSTPRDVFIEAARRIRVAIDVKSGGEQWVAKRVEQGEYDLAEIVWTGMVDTDVSAHLLHPHRASSPRIAQVLEAMRAAWDPAERTKLAADLAAALADVWPIAGVVAEAPKGLVHRRVQGVRVWDGWIDLVALRLETPR